MLFLKNITESHIVIFFFFFGFVCLLLLLLLVLLNVWEFKMACEKLKWLSWKQQMKNRKNSIAYGFWASWTLLLLFFFFSSFVLGIDDEVGWKLTIEKTNFVFAFFIDMRSLSRAAFNFLSKMYSDHFRRICFTLSVHFVSQQRTSSRLAYMLKHCKFVVFFSVSIFSSTKVVGTKTNSEGFPLFFFFFCFSLLFYF